MARIASSALRPYGQLDMSGGVQVGVSHLMRKRNEVEAAINVDLNEKIGAVKRRAGYEKVGTTIVHGNDSLGANVYRYDDNYKIIVGINDVNNATSTLKMLDNGGYWTTILDNSKSGYEDMPPNVRFQSINDGNEFYVAGHSRDYNYYLPLTNINQTMTPSFVRNTYTAPRAKFIAEYNGYLYAINCQVNDKTYRDRFYQSSPPIGFLTLVQTTQIGLLKQLRVNSAKYIKVGMTLAIYTGGTDAKLGEVTVVSVDKKNNYFSFLDTQLDIKDNDEVWLAGTKGQTNRFWNTDYKTPESSDWLKVPPGKEASPEFTGWGKNNNRLFLFTKNTFLKYDGQNLITVSDSVGCVSHESIQNIGSWTIWLHGSGVWGYNDSTGQLKMLSRSIQPYIDSIKQVNYEKVSAGVSGRVYKLAVGELLDLDGNTTSTSTSSTSTSSTSSSTSSTSTSSTSTSSTSSSTSRTTTSVSSTSRSTSTSASSTSTSTVTNTTTSTSSSTSVSTSFSTSTSSTSTSTSTAIQQRKIVRICYDFDMNAWWTEEHRREIRFQFNHTMSGYTKPYFTDDTGRLFRDETGGLDEYDTIPLQVEMGRNNLGTDQVKKFASVLVDSEKSSAATLQYSIDGGRFETLGQITNNVERMNFPQNNQFIEGRDINYKIVHNTPDASITLNGITTYYGFTEINVNEG